MWFGLTPKEVAQMGATGSLGVFTWIATRRSTVADRRNKGASEVQVAEINSDDLFRGDLLKRISAQDIRIDDLTTEKIECERRCARLEMRVATLERQVGTS